MNDVVNLIRLKRDADSVGLSELERETRERFEKSGNIAWFKMGRLFLVLPQQEK